MTNSLEDVYTAFFDRIEEDENFFNYFEIDEVQAMELARERARTYLREACSYLRRHVTLDFSLNIVADEKDEEVFSTKLTDDEIFLLVDIMLLIYFERGLAKLRPKLNTFAASELKLLHSPANERQTYVALIEAQRNRVDYLIADYYAKDAKQSADIAKSILG